MWASECCTDHWFLSPMPDLTTGLSMPHPQSNSASGIDLQQYCFDSGKVEKVEKVEKIGSAPGDMVVNVHRLA